MALPDLIARLEQDAEGQVRAILQEADLQAAAIETAARQERDRRTACTLDAQRDARQAALRRDLSDARRAARSRELEAGEALLARVLARARALFPDVSATDEYRRWLTALCAETLSYLEGVPCHIRCRPADVALVSAAVAQREDVTVAAGTGVGPGLVAEALDGSVAIDQTLDARLTRLAGSLAIDLIAEVRRGED